MTTVLHSPLTRTPVDRSPLPAARGPLTEALLPVLLGHRPASGLPSGRGADPYGEDVQLALHLLYELHYRDTDGVDAELEWDLDLLRLRRALEDAFLAAVRDEVPGGDDVEAALAPLLLEPVTGTGTSWWLRAHGERWHLREYAAHRSVYHLKEADPQTWVVPRLQGQAKAAMVTVQHDEYGAGRAERMHAELFRALLVELGLSGGYGAHVDLVPAATLTPVNLMSLLALRRTLRGAAVGQFATIEITSSPGSRRIAEAADRLGAPAARAFYDEHVEADAVHEQVLRHGLLADLLEREPALAADVVLGVQAHLLLEDRMGDAVVGAWTAGRSSLLGPLPA